MLRCSFFLKNAATNTEIMYKAAKTNKKVVNPKILLLISSINECKYVAAVVYPAYMKQELSTYKLSYYSTFALLCSSKYAQKTNGYTNTAIATNIVKMCKYN